MALEAALTTNELLNFIISSTTPPPPPPTYDDLHNHHHHHSTPTIITTTNAKKEEEGSKEARRPNLAETQSSGRKKKKRRRTRKQRASTTTKMKNREEAEAQRMTHITVERNRRRQMNEHLSLLRSLMPQSYVQRGDQASIVGGAIEFVKELEHLLQTLEAQKFLLLQQGRGTPEAAATVAAASTADLLPPPFGKFFSYPQYSTSWCDQTLDKHTSKAKASSVADIEVTLIETHANLRILSRRSFRQLSRIVGGLHSLYLTILHLNVTSLDPLVLYSISAKVEEGCQLNSADDIAGAIHHMMRIMEEEAILFYQP